MPNAAAQFLEHHPLTVFLIAYYSGVNLICFSLYGWDKASARAQTSRISERTMHGWTLAGGALGALCGQAWFRHKTQKTFFRWFAWFCFAVHVVLLLQIVSTSGIPLDFR